MESWKAGGVEKKTDMSDEKPPWRVLEFYSGIGGMVSTTSLLGFIVFISNLLMFLDRGTR